MEPKHLTEVPNRTLVKWHKALLEIQQQSRGSFWSQINYALSALSVEMEMRGVSYETADGQHYPYDPDAKPLKTSVHK